MENELNQEIPSDDEIKSFILTLRFFIQDNEPCSIRNLDKHYEKLSLPVELINEFKESRNSLNDYLDSKTHFGPKDKPHYTFREIFENYIYGHFAHSNNKKRDQIKIWDENKFIRGQTKFFFIGILYKIFSFLQKITNINNDAIKHISIS
ncbi:MAG: hypothetical protein ACQETE_09165 [Bacteroidota bacterium]